MYTFRPLARSVGYPFHWVNLELQELPVDCFDVIAVADESTYFSACVRDVADSCDATGLSAGAVGLAVLEALNAISAITGALAIKDTIRESISVVDRILIGYTVAVSNSISCADTLTLKVNLIRNIAEIILIADSQTIKSQLIAAVSVALTLVDVATPGLYAAVTETAITADTIATKLANWVALVETVLSTTSLTLTTGLRLTVLETGIITDTTTVNQALLAAISEQLIVLVELRLGDDEYIGYVFNPQSGALSEYHNFPFTGIAQLGERWFATAESGLYELTGDTDAGVDIDAQLRTGYTELGASQLKYLIDVLLYYRADGPMRLKVRAIVKGQVHEYWYQMVEQPATAPREGVIKIGKGITSKAFEFCLENVDGADFDLFGWTVTPVIRSGRRIS